MGEGARRPDPLHRLLRRIQETAEPAPVEDDTVTDNKPRARGKGQEEYRQEALEETLTTTAMVDYGD